MREQSDNLPQVFHMSLVEPLSLAVIFPILGVALSVWLLPAKLIDIGPWPIVILIFCVFAIVQGMTMPIKMENIGREIIIGYLVRKRVINIVDIKSFFMDEEKIDRYGRTRDFVTMQLNTGEKIRFKNIKEDNQSLLDSLEKWTGVRPSTSKDFVVSHEQEHPTIQNKTNELQTPVPLSIQTEQLIQKLFPPSEHDEIRQFLLKHGNGFYPEFLNKDQLEDLRLKALKKSKGNLKKLHSEIAWLSPK